MSQDVETVMIDFGREIARMATSTIFDDIQEVMANDEQFANPEAVGSELTGVKPPLESSTIRMKLGFPFPEKPRYRSGMMFESLAQEIDGDLEGEIGLMDFDSEKVNTQQFGEGNTPARPFMGVSNRALGKIESGFISLGDKLVAEYDKVILEPVIV